MSNSFDHSKVSEISQYFEDIYNKMGSLAAAAAAMSAQKKTPDL